MRNSFLRLNTANKLIEFKELVGKDFSVILEEVKLVYKDKVRNFFPELLPQRVKKGKEGS